MRDWATRRGSEKRWGAEPAMAASRRLPAEPLAGGCEIIAVKDGVLVPAANKRFYEFTEKKKEIYYGRCGGGHGKARALLCKKIKKTVNPGRDGRTARRHHTRICYERKK